MSIYTENDLRNLQVLIKKIGFDKAVRLYINGLTEAIGKAMCLDAEEAYKQAFEVVDEMVETIRGNV